jgi:hypothetical protein
MVSSQQHAAAAAAERSLVATKATTTPTAAKVSPLQEKGTSANLQQQLQQRLLRPIQVTSRSMLYESDRPEDFRPYYKMTYEAFWELCSRLHHGVKAASDAMASWKEQQQQQEEEERQKTTALLLSRDENGRVEDPAETTSQGNPPPPPARPHRTIPTSICLACAIRFLEGSSTVDMFLIHEITHAEAREAVWYGIHAVNQLDEFGIQYPAEHEKLHRIATSTDLSQATTQLRLDEATIKALKNFLYPRKRPAPGLKRAPRKKHC